MTRILNLNADLGESFGAWQMGQDTELLGSLDSASIACGFHAGDPLVMRDTLRRARAAGVGVGAHPAYPDLQGFGRRPMTLPAAELEAILIYQMAALAGMARAEGLAMVHVKPHGALSNMACVDANLADTVATAIRAFDASLILLAPACSALADAGRRAGLRGGGGDLRRPGLPRRRQPGATQPPRRPDPRRRRLPRPCARHARGRGPHLVERHPPAHPHRQHLRPRRRPRSGGHGPRPAGRLLERGYRLAGLEAIAAD
jgi:hypothetical protein